jgi:hypothetical protein
MTELWAVVLEGLAPESGPLAQWAWQLGWMRNSYRACETLILCYEPCEIVIGISVEKVRKDDRTCEYLIILACRCEFINEGVIWRTFQFFKQSSVVERAVLRCYCICCCAAHDSRTTTQTNCSLQYFMRFQRGREPNIPIQAIIKLKM